MRRSRKARAARSVECGDALGILLGGRQAVWTLATFTPQLARTDFEAKQIPIHGRVLCVVCVDLVSKQQGVSFKMTSETVTALECLADDLFSPELRATSACSMRTGWLDEQLHNIAFLVDKDCLNSMEENGSGCLPSSDAVEVLDKPPASEAYLPSLNELAIDVSA